MFAEWSGSLNASLVEAPQFYSRAQNSVGEKERRDKREMASPQHLLSMSSCPKVIGFWTAVSYLHKTVT